VLDTWFAKLACLIFTLGVTTACNSSQVDANSPLTTTAEIVPYLTPSTNSIDLALSEKPTLTPSPQPTPTPYIYIVVEGDNPTVIAARFGITTEELLAANPGIVPQLLSIGSELIIPISEGDSHVVNLGLPAPIPVDESEPICYPTTSNGLWCFWSVKNNHPTPLENLSATVSLSDVWGKELYSQTAFSPLNVLWQGDTIPLTTYFPPPVPSWSEVQVQLSTALEVTDEDKYLSSQINNLQVHVTENGLSAIVSGAVTLQKEEKSANRVWVAAVAYDKKGEVVGVRRWEGGKIEGRESLQFFTLVYSLGPPIDRVDILVEAQP
jgi:LysM repeat protein